MITVGWGWCIRLRAVVFVIAVTIALEWWRSGVVASNSLVITAARWSCRSVRWRWVAAVGRRRTAMSLAHWLLIAKANFHFQTRIARGGCCWCCQRFSAVQFVWFHFCNFSSVVHHLENSCKLKKQKTKLNIRYKKGVESFVSKFNTQWDDVELLVKGSSNKNKKRNLTESLRPTDPFGRTEPIQLVCAPYPPKTKCEREPYPNR